MRQLLQRNTGVWAAGTALCLLLGVTACGKSQVVESPSGTGGFVEVAEKAGIDFHMTFLATEQGEKFKINLYDHGTGVCVADYDGDGDDDIYLLNQLGPNSLFRNNGDGTFTDVTEDAGIGLDDRICTSASFADIDNDGDQDLFVASTRGGNAFFRNEGDGKFTEATAEAGLELVAHTQGVTFFDYDNDGWLDLYITNTAKWTLRHRDPTGLYYLGPDDLFSLVQSEPEQNILYRNRGDGTFEDVTDRAGVAGAGWGGDLATFDADGDGNLDLFVTNMFGVSTLYRNLGNGRFLDITRLALGDRTSWGAVGCKPLDYDGDGNIDLFLVDMHSDMWMQSDLDPARIEETKRYAGPEGPKVEWGDLTHVGRDRLWEQVRLDAKTAASVQFGNTLFRNDGEGRFTEVGIEANAETFWPWGIAAADFDLDGHEDAFLPSGMGYPFFYWRNSMLMNQGNGEFAFRAKETGIEPPPGGKFLKKRVGRKPACKSSRAAAVIDYDGDGRPDLVVNNFNERAYLYHNEFPARSWVALRLQGTKSNRDAIGALVRLTVGDRTLVRQVHGAGGYLAQSTKTLYFGLGAAKKIDAVEVIWPSGKRQQIGALELGRRHDLVEPE